MAWTLLSYEMGPASVNLIGGSVDYKFKLSLVQSIESEPPHLDSSVTHSSFERRRDAKRMRKIQAASQEQYSLSASVQETLLGVHWSSGWGKLPHGLTRRLKCPKDSGLKLVEIAVIMTVFDSTLAKVQPTMFTAIKAEEFEEQTGIDIRDVRRTLNALVLKGALLKLILDGVNFWGLNPHYFSANNRGTPQVKLPMGEIPRGNAPSDKKGELPSVTGGEFPPGKSESNTENNKGIQTPQNLIQESLKESHLGNENFPSDMLTRWTEMKTKGQEQKAIKEREIFKSLYLTHKQSFFEKCGKVIAFLEKYGSIKNGKAQVIHSPMVWIQGHWEANLARYENWVTEQSTLQKTQGEKLDREAQRLAKESNERTAKEQSEQEDIAFRAKWDAVADRFLSFYRDPSLRNAFAQEAIRIAQNTWAMTYFQSHGWDNPCVRLIVLEHFFKVENGLSVTNVSAVGKGK